MEEKVVRLSRSALCWTSWTSSLEWSSLLCLSVRKVCGKSWSGWSNQFQEIDHTMKQLPCRKLLVSRNIDLKYFHKVMSNWEILTNKNAYIIVIFYYIWPCKNKSEWERKKIEFFPLLQLWILNVFMCFLQIKAFHGKINGPIKYPAYCSTIAQRKHIFKSYGGNYFR